MIKWLPKWDYLLECVRVGIVKSWYGLPRGFTDMKDIFLNQDAFFIDARDMQLLLAHEQGHINGKEHTWLGVMSPWGLIRYISTFGI